MIYSFKHNIQHALNGIKFDLSQNFKPLMCAQISFSCIIHYKHTSNCSIEPGINNFQSKFFVYIVTLNREM